MPYDLYGNSYKSSREAEAAELSQMNEIDNRINREQLQRLERQDQNSNYEIWQYITMLEKRIEDLEKIVNSN